MIAYVTSEPTTTTPMTISNPSPPFMAGALQGTCIGNMASIVHPTGEEWPSAPLGVA